MNTSDEKYFMNWDEAFNSTAAQVGGKGYNMARLHRYGFQVPAGGVLISRVYRDFLESNGLSDHINAVASIKAESVLDPAIEKTLTEIREKIFKDMWDTVELWKQRNFHATNDQELISHFSETSPKLLGFASTYMVFTSLTSVSLTFLIQALDRDFPGRSALVEERKKMREELSSLEPPDVIIDDAPQPKVQAPEARGQVLAGIGVAAGRASGKARLISHPRENTRLQAGDILVAPSTDPGWTPLFLRAKAVVMEIGGYLSFSSQRIYGKIQKILLQ